ncbi:MAG: NADH-quinone oxidoreductase subunit NuoK [Ilumatobacter sp.]|uniref:NADH-quinone oxidoreductase subunit NuoK n=1 Tax=Ilumatobacter sp. TaxID=1967498 RepID=UPI0026268A1F|nr:NADH-quinone oxidoreductase subunit NuoK [Ilumatobacter sp.]MDJ0770774.1 NADH-quinone oxidoreductase subunit NuoK [Ilumatobacter sp.]
MTGVLIADVVPTTGYYLVLSAVLFGVGATGLMVRRNPLIMFMCVELMLNAVNLTFVALAVRFGVLVDPQTGDILNRGIDGQTAVFFVLVVAAAEVVVGLGIIISILKRRPGATADDLAELKG